MKRHTKPAVVAFLLSIAGLPVATEALAGEYLAFKASSPARNCLDGLIPVPAGEPLDAQPLLLACLQVAHQAEDTLVWDGAAASCMTFEAFAASVDANIFDTFIQYGQAAGALASVLEEIFVADANAVASFDSATGEVVAVASTICTSGTAPPPPGPEPVTLGAFLKASNPYFNDLFGTSVAISGNTVVVGAPKENSDSTGVNGDDTNSGNDDSGAVYVFVFSDGAWSQQAYLKASNAGYQDEFGYSVAISGNTLVVGAWLEDSNAIGVDGDGANNSRPNSGAAYVFVREGETWSQQAYLKASNTNTQDLFGSSVAIDGDTLVVGAFGEASGIEGDQADNSRGLAGAAYVFVRNGENWAQQAYLKAPYPNYQYLFGASVAVAGDTLVVGSPQESSDAKGVNGEGGDNTLADDSGAAFVFTRSGQTWSRQAYLKASNAQAFDQFGKSVAISGHSIAVGAWYEESNATGVNGDEANNSAGDSGAAYVFVRAGETWSQQAYVKASNTGGIDWFGSSVSIEGDRLLVGAMQERSNATGLDGDQANNTANQAGAAYVYDRDAGEWSQRAYVKASNTGAFDQFGATTAISDGVMVVGAPRESSDSTGVGGPDNDLMGYAGAAYVILLPQEIVVDLSSGPLAPGSIFTVTGIGFKPATLVQAWLQSEPVLVAEAIADVNGAVAFEITIPLGFPPGEHRVILSGLNPDGSERQLSAPITTVSNGTIFSDGFEQ